MLSKRPRSLGRLRLRFGIACEGVRACVVVVGRSCVARNVPLVLLRDDLILVLHRFLRLTSRAHGLDT